MGWLKILILVFRHLVQFLKTLKGDDVFSNTKWSDPFTSDGTLTIIPLSTITSTIDNTETNKVMIFPNPADDHLSIRSDITFNYFEILNSKGQLMKANSLNNQLINVSELPAGFYFLKLSNKEKNTSLTKKVMVY